MRQAGPRKTNSKNPQKETKLAVLASKKWDYSSSENRPNEEFALRAALKRAAQQVLKLGSFIRFDSTITLPDKLTNFSVYIKKNIFSNLLISQQNFEYSYSYYRLRARFYRHLYNTKDRR